MVGGSASISSSGPDLSIHQHSDRAVIDWRGFDIAAGQQTTFYQPSANSVVLNRVNSSSASHIDGKLTANGRVIIVNQNGLMFGQNAVVDVNSLIATTADIENKNLMKGHLRFDKPGNPRAAVVNEGRITAREGGLIGFVAPAVLNHGIIEARLGRVHLASGDTATIDLYGDGLMEVAVSDGVTASLVSNTGAILADGGKIALTASAGQHLVNSLIVARGALRAQSIARQNGEIIISAAGANKTDKAGASTVVVDATIDTSGRNAGERGGDIRILGDHISLLDGTRIDASGHSGKSGTTKNKSLFARRRGAAGGDIQIGGDYLGGGDTQTARSLFVGEGVLVLNDALFKGDAGRTIFWSDGTTRFYGNVYARALGGQAVNSRSWNASAGGNTGDGGFVETSGHDHLDAGGYVDLTASNGNRGTYFLDPTNITIYGNVDPAFISTDSSINLNAGLGLWLDPSDASKVTLTYSTDSMGGATATGTSGTNTLITSADVANKLAAGARIRLGAAGSVTTADTMGADTYTISAISGTTITLTSNLSASYSGSALYRGLVSQLADKSSGSHHAVQSTQAKMPLWVSGGQNGNGILNLDGTGDFLLTDSLQSFVSKRGALFSVFTNDSAAGYGAILSTYNHAAVGWEWMTATSGPKYKFWDHSSTKTAAVNDPTATWQIQGFSRTGDTSADIIRDGAVSETITITNNQPSAGIVAIGANTVGTELLRGRMGDSLIYNGSLDTNATALITQYQSAKWGIALTPPGTGATEVAKATASDGYSVFTTRYLEGLSESANISLQATNNINLDLKGDTLNFTTSGRNLTLTAGNQITTASAGNITTTNGNITFAATGGITLNHTLGLTTTGGGNIMLSNNVTLGANQNWNAGSGTMTFSGTVNGSYNLTGAAGAFSFGGALGDVTPLGAVSLTSVGNLTLPSITASSALARTTGATSDITIPISKVITASGAGTSLILASGRDFINSSGVGALSAPSGRWLIYSANPASDTIGSLTNNFRRFSCTYGGSCPALGTGNGLLYSYTPTLTATPSAISATYGAVAPGLAGYAYTLSGYLGSDAGSDNVTGSLSGTTAYSQGNNAGSYNIDYDSGALASDMGYGFSYADHTTALTINPRALTVTPDNGQGKIYGTADPALTYILTSGSFYNTDTFSGALNRVAGATVAGGPYAITQGTLSAGSNYTITFTAGRTFAITPYSLSVTADAFNKIYGAADPALTYTFGTLQNGDTGSVFTGSLARAAGETVAGGPYVITQGTLSAGSNYTISYTGADLTITPAALSITADNQNKNYGTTFAFLGTEFTSSGLQNGETIGTVTLLSPGTGSGATAAGSPYAITASAATGGTFTASNYTITYHDGALTVTGVPSLPPTVLSVSQSPSMNLANTIPALLAMANPLNTEASASPASEDSGATTENTGANSQKVERQRLKFFEGLLEVSPELARRIRLEVE